MRGDLWGCHLTLLRSCALSDPCNSSSRIWETKAPLDFSMLNTYLCSSPSQLSQGGCQFWMAPVQGSLWVEVLVGRCRCFLCGWSVGELLKFHQVYQELWSSLARSETALEMEVMTPIVCLLNCLAPLIAYCLIFLEMWIWRGYVHVKVVFKKLKGTCPSLRHLVFLCVYMHIVKEYKWKFIFWVGVEVRDQQINTRSLHPGQLVNKAGKDEGELLIRRGRAALEVWKCASGDGNGLDEQIWKVKHVGVPDFWCSSSNPVSLLILLNVHLILYERKMFTFTRPLCVDNHYVASTNLVIYTSKYF